MGEAEELSCNRSPISCENARLPMETKDSALTRHLLLCASCIVRMQASYYDAPLALERKIRQSLRQAKSVQAPDGTD